jgi:sensor histidine kinase regulating citrate/malate metabolism
MAGDCRTCPCGPGHVGSRCVWAIRSRLQRQTRGLRPDELRVMYDHHDATLHSVSEGLIVLDREKVAVANDEARRLLGLPAGPVARSELPQLRDPARPTRCT